MGTGWLALSWPEPETRLSMIGGIAVLGRMVNAVGSVGVYDLTSHHFTGVVPANPEKPRAFSISDVTFQQGSAGSMMSFRRPLTHMYTGQASYTLQAAYHPSSNEMEYHGGGVTGFEIALGTLGGHSGAVYKAEDMRAYYLWHGWLMFAGWGVLIPIGTLFARRLKDCGPVWCATYALETLTEREMRDTPRRDALSIVPLVRISNRRGCLRLSHHGPSVVMAISVECC